MWLLSASGYVERPEGVQTLDIAQPASAITCLWMLMTFIPAGVALLSLMLLWIYPLGTKEMESIVSELNERRQSVTEVPFAIGDPEIC